MKLYFYTLRNRDVVCHESGAKETVSTYRNFFEPQGLYRKTVRKDEIGEVVEGNTVVLLEKSDALAKEIFSRYLSKEIESEQARIDGMKKQLEIVERWEIRDVKM